MIVYTTVLGQTDPLHEPHNPDGFRFVCFTDRPLKSRHWEIVQVPATDAPARECRKLKQLSHATFPEADATLWLDAAFELLVSPAKVAALATADVMGFKHPDRTRISQEAPAIVRAGKGLEGPTMAQLESYQAAGWDADDNPQGHITNGGFLFRRHTPSVKRFNEAWHREVQTRTLRDQMSIDYCAWREGMAIGHYPGNVRRNGLARIHFLRGKRTTDF